MAKVNSWGQSGLLRIMVEQQALLLIILEKGQKGSTQKEIQQRAEKEGIYFSDFRILENLRELEGRDLVRSAVFQSTERWYSVLEVA